MLKGLSRWLIYLTVQEQRYGHSDYLGKVCLEHFQALGISLFVVETFVCILSYYRILCIVIYFISQLGVRPLIFIRILCAVESVDYNKV